MSDTWRQWEGQIIDGQFQLRRHLGGSDHSVVFLTERDDESKAAIKFIQADPPSAEAQLLRWKESIKLTHPNLIQLFNCGRCQLAGMDLLYVVMEYADENLAQFLPQRALSPVEAKDMLEPFLETLTYLHGKGFVHGHLKPGNVLAIDDQLKLSCDTLVREGESRAVGEKASAYTPPEGVNAKVTPASDVWSLGVTLMEALTQRAVPPEELELHGLASEEKAYAASDMQKGAAEGHAAAATLPEPFLDIARHCLHHDPKQRWSIADVARRLNPHSPAAQPVHVSNPALPEPKVLAPTSVRQTTETPAPPRISEPIDPLAVPLSQVAPPPASQRHALQHQAVARPRGQSDTIPMIGASARSYYIVVGMALVVIVSAALAIPRLRNHGTEASQQEERSTPAAEPQPTVTATSEVPAEAKPQPKAQAKAANETTELSSAQARRGSAKHAEQDSVQTASEKEKIHGAAAGAPVEHSVLDAGQPAATPAGPVSRGEVLNQVLPEISQKSRSTIRGTVKVVVKVSVDPSGAVSAADFSSRGPSRFFADAALEAAKKWDFTPAKMNGQNAPSEWLITFGFTQTGTNVSPVAVKP